MSQLAKKDRFFHETWLGMVQPVEGLVLSVPTLVEAQCAERQSTATHRELAQYLCDEDGPIPALSNLPAFLSGFLGWEDRLLVRTAELPDELRLWVPEGSQELRPTLAFRDPYPQAEARRPADRGPAADTPAARAADDLVILVWEVPRGLDLDKAETETGEWRYPPARKFERLLRHARVPLGLLSNGEVLRLCYAPHGESLGSITFRVADMAQTGGRPILDALVMLLHANALLADPERALPALVRKSRARQADVTEELARQVFEALQILLDGFEAAGGRSEQTLAALEEALAAEDNHLYGGLLAVLLRLVFVLYAEDNGVLPTEHPFYQEHLSVLGLFAQLQEDAGAYPDSMDRRFGAWPRLLALFRAIHGGVSHGKLDMPPRRGRLFAPDSYPFLEGRLRSGAAQVGGNAAIETPRVDDGAVYRVLKRLLILEGQRLSYRSLDVEQIGSVYERLMGYRVERLGGEAVCIKAGEAGAWLSADAITDVAAAHRARWLKDELGVPNAQAKKLAAAVKAAKTDEEVLQALETLRYAPNRKAVGRRRAGQWVLQPGKERIRTSSHYTPRTLSQPIVERTLEPVIAALGDAPTAEQLLSLKVCDPAMGSGAFLVEACRFLGDQVVSAWAREGKLEAIGEQVHEPTVYARRLVAQRCLYGVDKNPFAVDLARMSLWLITLARKEPFTFVDHALKHGDSLVGLSLDAIRRFDWDEERSLTIDAFHRRIEQAVLRGLDKRQEILELAREEGAGLTGAKEELLEEAHLALMVPKLVGEVLVGAWFSESKEKAKDQARRERLAVLSDWLSQDDIVATIPPEVLDWANEIREQTPVFHWPLEFPEIFHERRPDPLDGDSINNVAMMDAFIGNPPFMGGRRIRSMLSDAYTAWVGFVHQSSLNADISAHFFRRVDSLLGAHGTVGLIATNTVAQGDTRTAGLAPLVRSGVRIYEASESIPWPGTAAVTVSILHLAKGLISAESVLNGSPVSMINSRLRPIAERDDPKRLCSNTGLSFQGSVLVGTGFILTPEERDELIAQDNRNSERIFPFIGGQELNTNVRQEHSRYVINFGDMPLPHADAWPDLLARVRALVKPSRDQVRRDAHRKYWWHFGDKRPALYSKLSALSRCLACSIVSKHLVFAWQPALRVFSHRLLILPVEHDSYLAVLQSRLHDSWARLLSSTLETRINYAPSDCFDTFAFPQEKAMLAGTALDRAGKALDEARAAYCIERDQGLTATYNDLKGPEHHDPQVERLRALHLDVDRAVIEAYGWQDVPVPRHLFPASPEEAKETMPLIEAIPPYTDPVTEEETRAFQRFEDAVIDQLFALNAERAAEEAAERKKAKPKKAGKKKSSPPKRADDSQGELPL